jgi:hypothetical protein
MEYSYDEEEADKWLNKAKEMQRDGYEGNARRYFVRHLKYSGVPKGHHEEAWDAFQTSHRPHHVTETAKCIHFRGREGWRSKEVRY